MTEEDRATEIKLREEAQSSDEVNGVLADFYEERGQPTRARAWRSRPSRADRTHDVPPDLFFKKHPGSRVDPRRDAMIWLLSHVLPTSAISDLFELSRTRVKQIVQRHSNNVLNKSHLESRGASMAATQRLIAAGALMPSAEQFYNAYTLDEIPPHTWPLTRNYERSTKRDRR